jgi:hypothetical protein
LIKFHLLLCQIFTKKSNVLTIPITTPAFHNCDQSFPTSTICFCNFTERNIGETQKSVHPLCETEIEVPVRLTEILKGEVTQMPVRTFDSEWNLEMKIEWMTIKTVETIGDCSRKDFSDKDWIKYSECDIFFF